MKIKDLPSSGGKFRVSSGAGNFSKKLSSATRAGELRNLNDNKEAIVKALKKHERVIRLGGFNRLRQIKAMSDIKKLEGSKLTKDDKKDIRKIFKHLSSGKPKDEKPVSKVKIDKQLDKDESFAKDLKEEARNRITRMNRTRGGGETHVRISNDPYKREDEEMSTTAKLLQRRYTNKEDRVSQRLPKSTVNWEQERTKRFEVSSLDKVNKEDPKGGGEKNNKVEKNVLDKPDKEYQSFQNL